MARHSTRTRKLHHLNSRGNSRLHLEGRNRKLCAMKHAILGAGAIGGLVGTALGSLGDDVTMIVRQEKLAGYPQSLTLERPSGTLTAPIKAVSSLVDSVDVLWIATKTYQLEAALSAVEALPTIVLPL